MADEGADVSAFRATLQRDFERPPKRRVDATVISASWIETRLGGMVTIADHRHVLLLEFADRPDLVRQMRRLSGGLNAIILFGTGGLEETVSKQIARYFIGRSLRFDLPIADTGTPFQRRVWSCLQAIPPGETLTYTDLAGKAGKPKAIRAAAAANAINRWAIVVPCHRVIGSDGSLTGYAGGLARKRWLLDHEAAHAHRR